ncbi:hypothetical protein GGX14DRAFT_375067, partial [Mycena pura]
MPATDVPLPTPTSLSKSKRERPPALDIAEQPQQSAERESARQVRLQPSVLITPTGETDASEPEYPPPRSASATSSLDPYYFGLSDSPVPPLPTGPIHISTTPDQTPDQLHPVTPARDPAMIDRRGLVGVGELTTPRWTRARHDKEDTTTPVWGSQGERFEIAAAEDRPDAPDSPWTIEAVDGEMSEREELPGVNPTPRTLRERPSMTEESGGEEILYPRKLNNGPSPELPAHFASDRPSSSLEPSETDFNSTQILSDPPLSEVQTSPPPSAFSQPKRARKRTSDEFELDQTGSLVSKRISSSKDKMPGDEKPVARKHRSLNVSSPNKTKERRRESNGLAHSGSLKILSSPAKTSERHSRHASTSSSSSSHADTARRVHTTDFSHLPPSPSSSSILSFLKYPGPGVPQTPPPIISTSRDISHPSPNVAHSLLRGTQEGWSGMDDEATAEALRKLDGLSGKSARARASVASFTRSTGSRPGTPAKSTTTQWEGIGPMDPGRRASGAIRDSGISKERAGVSGLASEGAVEGSDVVGSAISSDEQPFGPSTASEKTPKKGTGSARSSFTPKRGSTSSTTYA